MRNLDALVDRIARLRCLCFVGRTPEDPLLRQNRDFGSKKIQFDLNQPTSNYFASNLETTIQSCLPLGNGFLMIFIGIYFSCSERGTRYAFTYKLLLASTEPTTVFKLLTI